ncbi:alpha/beta fold hydrolase [Sphingobium sp. AP49]|uniref:alpha/beta hydrolase family protein n=1 Tax=Sphingobium sp. AP49 TaxID=1144307 RepID=UPI00026ECABB|nr:alpha/beta fold hydrolase [Sphingobium sp. AP49]WHO40857.1 alpha/beta fold hydrolase [Sphingobium sp. AP49]
MTKVWNAARLGALLGVSSLSAMAHAEPDALAKAFGARETVISASLSADGEKIALVAAGPGRTTRVYALDAKEGGEPKVILSGSGKPEYLTNCDWVGAARLSCNIFSTQRLGDDVYSSSNIVAVDSAGGNVKGLSQKRGENALGYDLRGGAMLDFLPNEDGAVLMARSYVPEAKAGSLIEKKTDGLGVDRVDTRTGAIRRVEVPNKNAYAYITDGHGNVRVMGLWERKDSGYFTGRYKFLYRKQNESDWSTLSLYDGPTNTGFYPIAVDPDKNVAYGLEKKDGRDALMTVQLDAGLEKTLIYANPRVDVSGVVQVGRDRRIVGASYIDEYGEAIYFDPEVDKMATALGKALGGKSVHIGDMSVDGQRLLIWGGSDTDPGQYYLYDKRARKLSPVMPDRPELAGRQLAEMKAIQYKAKDGTLIPAYLTLPPGKSDAKGLPAIVMPHGGPQSRDSWGFDWLAQYYAARGFAVVQPQFRGSGGFGDAWLAGNGFRSWRTAIGDVVDAGHWLLAQGADPTRLTILGWSYGGYAALQAQALDPKLFKAIVAIAPVTDISDMLRRSRFSASYLQNKDYLGTGSDAAMASPANHAAEFQAPVLMFHGTDDNNVDITQARIMQSKLEGAGKHSRLVVYDGLAHSLNDSDVRADMLQQSADFLLAVGK